MRKPIYVNTPEENLLGLVNFHSGDETERKEALWSLLVAGDINEEGKIDFQTISCSETKLSELPVSLQEILKEDFSGEITDDSLVLMRFFKKENEQYVPVYVDPEQVKTE